jgi:hypothetical protein
VASDAEGSGIDNEMERESATEREDGELYPKPNRISKLTFDVEPSITSMAQSAEGSGVEGHHFDVAQGNASVTRPSAEYSAEHDASATHLPIGSQMPTNSKTELTRTGRRTKRRDMTGLSQCLCGEKAQSDDAGSIQCQRAGCETVWVSDPPL